ncbi:MAG: hypothetical protein KAJ75_04820 [Alphaproteobacteria bacterium]|nr:hypothetical protein [Alphaproteobacteria bacterium]
MPLIYLMALAVPTSALAFNSVTRDTERAVKTTGNNLITIGVAGLALYWTFCQFNKGRFA